MLFSTVSSAQAAAAAMSMDPYEEGSSSSSFHHMDRRKSSSKEPVVMLEPLRSTVSSVALQSVWLFSSPIEGHKTSFLEWV